MPPPRDPSSGQTAEEIERYYRNVKIGDPAAIRTSQYGRLEIKITTVSNINPEAGSIHLNDDAVWGGVAYSVESGKSYYATSGQSSLIVPNESVTAWAKANPRGTPEY
ncbi:MULTISPECIES: hypothetical protein [unclassified Nitrobacter]|uniref:hypothetical protein n=1 Tax=unclassified Nitrobacter TaxID=2620411 RepID=UPI0009270E42|nr:MULTISPECIES: hypothetical protein [unclassified Nitrobacter]MBN9147194.1 hypothetical protein [Nitrobacter sp.]OJV02309.1 MAG: hypothetical protein BGO16_01795 [Nitrobacter sp. 62-23]